MSEAIKTKPEIFYMTVEIKPPKGDFPGQTLKGAFTFVNDVVTLCHPTTGEPVQDPTGKRYTFKLEPPTTTLADAETHARRLTKDFRVALRGGRPAGFGGPGSPGGPKGPIAYPKNTGYY
jgi:hypothetical protein